MSALHWPAYTEDEIAECLRLAFASSPLAQPPEANYRCRVVPEPRREAELIAGVTCSGDERYDDRTAAPEARR
jgi:hypothetical protein